MRVWHSRNSTNNCWMNKVFYPSTHSFMCMGYFSTYFRIFGCLIKCHLMITCFPEWLCKAFVRLFPRYSIDFIQMIITGIGKLGWFWGMMFTYCYSVINFRRSSIDSFFFCVHNHIFLKWHFNSVFEYLSLLVILSYCTEQNLHEVCMIFVVCFC